MPQSTTVLEPRGRGESKVPGPRVSGDGLVREVELLDVSYLLAADGRRSPQGQAALRAVARGILERVARHGTLRPETIPAMWPMTRHLVRRVADALVSAGVLERQPSGALRASGSGGRPLPPARGE